LLFFLFLLLSGKPSSFGFLIVASIAAKLLGEYFFWHIWAQNVTHTSKGKNWQLNYKKSLRISHS
jgi:hypothetical protein